MLILYSYWTSQFQNFVIPPAWLSHSTTMHFTSFLIPKFQNFTNTSYVSVTQYYLLLSLWAMVSIRTLLQLSPPNPPSYQVCTRFVCCFIILHHPSFVMIRLLRKITHFQSKTNFFCQLIAGWFWFCCFVYMCFLERSFTLLSSRNYESIISRFHNFLFGLSSNHVT